MYGSEGIEREPDEPKRSWTPPVPLADWEIIAYQERHWEQETEKPQEETK